MNANFEYISEIHIWNIYHENICRINTCSCKSRYFEIWKSDIKIGVPHIMHFLLEQFIV